MNIAYVDDFKLWDREDIHTRETLAQLFDIRMLPDSEPGFLIGRYGIRNVWAKYAKKYELLAEEAIPLMNGLDPESWQEHTINQKGLPKDMVDSIRRCLRIAGAEGLIKDYPRKWLEWGFKHDLNKPIIRSDERVPEPNICMFAFFEAAVNEHIKEVPLSPDSNRLEDHELLEKVLPKLVQQENAILKYLISNGYDPLNLPAYQQGKESVKQDVREFFQKNPSLFTKASFDKAWRRLLQYKQLVYRSSR